MDSHLSADKRRQLRGLFEEAVDLSRRDQTRFLDRSCAHDPTLRRQVEALLEVDARVDRALTDDDSAASSRWEQIELLFDRAQQLPPEERPAFLEEVCGGDAALLAELESLLAYDTEAPVFFDNLVRDVMAPGGRNGGTTDSFATDSRLGQAVSHYQIEEKLGGGGMGVVYKARDTRLGRVVALKFLPLHLNADADAKARFVQEARAASALDHPNICTIHEIGETAGGDLFIAMAFYDGESLKKKGADGPLPLNEALDYAAQIAGGLAKAHDGGIVHRDIKPANVMVTREGIAKIVDFGLAKVEDVTLTRSGTTLGTVAYMSPEQARGEVVDQRTDLWALGVVLYELLTGERPFRGDYEQALLYALLHEEPPPLSEVNPSLPAELEPVLRRCLAKAPEARYQDAGALREDLKRVLHGLMTEAEVLESSVRQPKRSLLRGPFRRRHAFALLVGVIGIALLATFFIGNSLPAARHLAVLPFRVIGTDADVGALSAGLVETLTSKLTQLERYQGSLWVVPASEVREEMTPSEARERFGVTMVVTGSIQAEGERIRLTLTLVDVVDQRQLASHQFDYDETSTLALQDRAMLLLVQMLDVPLAPEARQALTAGGTDAQQANTFYLRGLGYLRNYESVEQLDLAIGLFKAAIAEDARFALAHAALGDAYWQKYIKTDEVRWAEEALRHSQRALELNAKLAPVYVTLGVIYNGRRQFDESLEAFRQALVLDPYDAEAYRRRARLYRDLGQFAEAEADYQQAIALKPEFWRGYNSLGVFYYAQGRYEDAVDQYQRGLDLAPANPSLLLNTGAAYWQMERLDEAIEMFERLLKLDATHASARSNLATAYFYRGRFEDAARLYEEELALNPSNYSVQGYLADTYHWIPGNRDRATLAYQRAIAMVREHLGVRPGDPELLGSLANFFAKLEQPDSARVYLRQLEAVQQPDQVGVVEAFGIGETYEQIGERERALRWMEPALRSGYGWVQVEYSPWLRDLRADPAFRALLASIDRNGR